MDMVVPPEFNYFCLQFHQDVGLVHATGEKMIAAALGALDEHQKDVVRTFLDQLLGGRYQPDEIRGVWKRSPADITFSTAAGLVIFLRRVRAAM